MTVQIDVDDATLAEVDENLRVLHQNRADFFRQGIMDLAGKVRREAEVARQYARAYGENSVHPEEFFVEEEQLVQAWKDL